MSLGGSLDLDILAEFGNPDTLCLEVRRNLALHGLGNVTTDTALFLGETGTMDLASNSYFGTADAANSGHKTVG